eukprot:scaffold262053_cov32-Tisochrysis_lutea.AAC.1
MPAPSAALRLLAEGDLYSARRLFLAECVVEGSPLGWVAAEVAQLDERCVRSCAADWRAALDALIATKDSLHIISRAHERHAATSRWVEGECAGSRLDPWLCHTVGNQSRSVLRLPALRDISLRVTLGGWAPVRERPPSVIRLEQDGFLRPFDVSTVLWPAGFLLAQWASDADQCHRWRRSGLPILELGAGVGAPSIGLAKVCGSTVRVIATDGAGSSLALLAANVQLNGVAGRVQIENFDWHSDDDLERVVAMGPFAAVIGAALQLEKWLDRLWYVLCRLTQAVGPGSRHQCRSGDMVACSAASDVQGLTGLSTSIQVGSVHEDYLDGGLNSKKHEMETEDKGDGARIYRPAQAGTLVVLVHNVAALPKPPPVSMLVETQRRSGLDYGVHTSWNESESDFEVVLLESMSARDQIEVDRGMNDEQKGGSREEPVVL